MRPHLVAPIIFMLSTIGCDGNNKSSEEQTEVISPQQNPILNRQTPNSEAAGLRFDSNVQTLKPLSQQPITTDD